MRRRHFWTILFLAFFASERAYAQDTYSWQNVAGGSYHTAGNWSPGGGPPIFNDYARFNLAGTYGVSFSNAGTQTIDFQVGNGNVTFSSLNTTAQHFWGSGSTNYVGPAAGAANSTATLNLTNMFHLPMRGNHLVVGRAAGKTGTLNINNNGNWESYSGGNFTLGELGTGNLNISTAGILQKSSLTATNVSLGTSGGTGNATVSGFNAALTATNVMTVGENSGSLGNLTISNQGQVTIADTLYVGVASVLDNKITVTGNGSELMLGNDLTSIGFGGGKGTLNVLSGGQVTNSGSSINIGDGVGSNGALSISNSSSQFLSTSTSTMRIGNSGTGTVNVSDGGNMTVNRLELGVGATGNGIMTLHGSGTLVDVWGTSQNVIGVAGNGTVNLQAGSVLSSNAMLVIGTSGIGTLSVQSGSQVYSSEGRIGLGPAGSSATIDGTGSLWAATNGLDIGWESTASLHVTNGGSVTGNGGRLGILAGSVGTANVSGTASHWNSTGSGMLVLGQSGQGQLNISSGGQVTSSDVAFGSLADGVASATIDGNNSQWTINDSAFIGDEGTGTLSISNGGALNIGANATVRLGHASTATGSLVVAGSTSDVSGGTGSALYVGGNGMGSLDVRQGADVQIDSATIGLSASGMGTATVRNNGSQLLVNETLTVGQSGQGTLTIQNGAAVSTKNLHIGRDLDSTGQVTLSGQNSSLNVTQNAVVGGALASDGGAGTLTINAGTTATVGGQLTIWSQGEVQLNGGTLQLATLNDQGGLFQWNQGTVEFTQNTVLQAGLLNSLVGSGHSLTNGQYLNGSSGTTLIVGTTNFSVDGGQINGTGFTNVGDTVINKGSVNMTGSFLNDVQGNMVVQSLGQANFIGGVQNNGNFSLGGPGAKSSGGLFQNNGTLSGSGRLQHQLDNHGSLVINGGDYLVVAHSANVHHNLGQIQMSGGRLEYTGTLSNEANAFLTGRGVLATSTSSSGGMGLFNYGTIATSGGALDIYGDVRNVAGGRVITSGQSVTTFWDDVEHNGFEIRTALGSSTVFYGEVNGSGSFTGLGGVYFEGDLKPGNSPANVQFEGDVFFGDLANVTFELGGSMFGSEYDRLTVAGDAWLNGRLQLELINGYVPNVGQEFLLIDNLGRDALNGNFLNLHQGDFLWAGSHQFQVNYFGGNGNDFVLTAVPEPSSLLMMLVACSFAASVRRQRRSTFRVDQAMR